MTRGGEDTRAGFSIVPADTFHDLAPLPEANQAEHLSHITHHASRISSQPAIDFVRTGYQLEARRRVQQERQQYAQIVRDYLTRSFKARIQATENRVMNLRAREIGGESEVALARQRAEQDLADLNRNRDERLGGLDRLVITRPGPVRHLATAVVLPPDPIAFEALLPDEMDEDAKRASELAAMSVAMAYERGRGWEPFDVSNQHDGCGFDIRSLGPADPATGQRPVRRIEVKGRKRGQPVRLTINEWLKSRQLGESYWLYVVWDPTGAAPELVAVPDPGHRLEYIAREVRSVSHMEIPAQAIRI
jgi:hypothetical protein